jgi:signal transduction histidine kinase
VLGEESFVAAFISDVRLRRGHEAQIRRNRSELQNLTERLIEMQEEEKRYLARELHDDFSQRLAALQMELAQMADSLEGEAGGISPANLQGRLERATQRISDLARDCHDLSRRLHSSVLDKVGLAAALQTEADEYLRRDNLHVKLDMAEGLHKLPAETALCLYRIAQEALRNVLVHSGQQEARIAIVRDKAGLAMTISDAGKGFDPGRIEHSRGLGLISMRERVRLLGGRCEIHAAPGEGVRITVGIAWPTS